MRCPPAPSHSVRRGLPKSRPPPFRIAHPPAAFKTRRRRSGGLPALANYVPADESRNDDQRREQYQAFDAAYFRRDSLPVRAKKPAGDDIPSAPRNRRDNYGRYENPWPDLQDSGRDRGVPTEKGNEPADVNSPVLSFRDHTPNTVDVPRGDREPSRTVIHDVCPE